MLYYQELIYIYICIHIYVDMCTKMIYKAEISYQRPKTPARLVVGLMNTMIPLIGWQAWNLNIVSWYPNFPWFLGVLGMDAFMETYFSNLLSLCFFDLPAMLESSECRFGVQSLPIKCNKCTNKKQFLPPKTAANCWAKAPPFLF